MRRLERILEKKTALAKVATLVYICCGVPFLESVFIKYHLA